MRRLRIVINILIGLATIAFIVGVTAPILTLKKLIFVKNTFSVLSGITALYSQGEYLLFILLIGFSLILPITKIGLLVTAWNARNSVKSEHERYLRWLSGLGKWSMLDVFVVAILVASVKLGALATIEIHYGLYAFATAVVLLMVITHVVHRRYLSIQT